MNFFFAILGSLCIFYSGFAMENPGMVEKQKRPALIQELIEIQKASELSWEKSQEMAVNVLSKLKQNTYDVNEPDEKGRVPLWYAVRSGKEKIVLELIARGAKASSGVACDSFNNANPVVAELVNQVAREAEGYGAHERHKVIPIERRWTGCIESLVKAGFDPNLPEIVDVTQKDYLPTNTLCPTMAPQLVHAMFGPRQQTPVQKAALHNFRILLQTLLKAGALVDKKTHEYAQMNDSYECLEIIEARLGTLKQ